MHLALMLYTVAMGGSDSNPGTDAQPWATLQKAADTVVAGDTVMVKAGSYAGFDLRASGAAGKPITFMGVAGQTRITADNGETPDGINVEGVQDDVLTDIVLDGFVVAGRTRAGVRVIWCNGCTVRHISADANGRWGIFTGFSTDLVIEDNTCSRSVAEHGIYVSNSGDRPTVRRNTLFSNNANGLHMNGDIDTPCDTETSGPECDGIISGALVENNVIYDNGRAGGSGINGDGVRDSTIRNNLIYESHASGISLYQIDGGGPSRGNLVVHNTVVCASDTGRWALNLQDGATGTRVYNNILLSRHATRGSIDMSADSSVMSNHNVFEDRLSINDTFVTLAQWRAMTGQDADSFVATEGELFVGGTDYHLSSTSKAINKGDPTQTTSTDLDGRPRDSQPDIGAYEATTGTPAVDAGTTTVDAAAGGPDAAPGGADARPAADAAAGGPDARPAAAGDASGCDCRLGTRGDGIAAAALAVLLLVLSRRRR